MPTMVITNALPALRRRSGNASAFVQFLKWPPAESGDSVSTAMKKVRYLRFLLSILPLLLGEMASGQTYSITTLGSLGGTANMDASGGVNAFGQAAGRSQTLSGLDHAFFFDAAATGMQDIGTLGGAFSRANGINNSGVVVGRSEISTGQSHAFSYTAASGLKDIHSSVSLGGAESGALAINDSGAIVGWATDSNGNTRAFFTRPTVRWSTFKICCPSAVPRVRRIRSITRIKLWARPISAEASLTPSLSM